MLALGRSGNARAWNGLGWLLLGEAGISTGAGDLGGVFYEASERVASRARLYDIPVRIPQIHHQAGEVQSCRTKTRKTRTSDLEDRWVLVRVPALRRSDDVLRRVMTQFTHHSRSLDRYRTGNVRSLLHV